MNIQKDKRFLLIFSLLFLLFYSQCSNQSRKKAHNDELRNSSSLYLQMHADNPIDWHIWSDSIWSEAQKEHKLILLSIGYSACHWCHVMEKESFSDSTVAKVMNKWYYCVKIDREASPDIENKYAQLQKKLIGWAGWPMHFILTPQKRVVWTGIYLPKALWINKLSNIHQNHQLDTNYQQFTRKEELICSPSSEINLSGIKKHILAISDTSKGGISPFHYSLKYPNAGYFTYLLNEYYFSKDKKIRKILEKGLNAMQNGGIFDQIEDGFFRFSMDEDWHIPHFEKMLYTNALLASVYAKAYKLLGDSSYLKTAERTIDFMITKLSSNKTSLFYSSLDADTKYEGAYYVYTKKELKKALGKYFDIGAQYYGIEDKYLWHDSLYHLQIKNKDIFNHLHSYSETGSNIKAKITQNLLKLRLKKLKPKLDNKMITSWNALAIIALCDVYSITNNKYYLIKAQSVARVLSTHFGNKTFQHYYTSTDNNDNKAVATDYLYFSDALIELYKYTYNENYLLGAKNSYQKYLKLKKQMYLFPIQDEALPSYFYSERKIMNHLNFYFRSNYTPQTISIDTLHSENYGFYLSTLLNEKYSFYELSVIKLSEKDSMDDWQKNYYPNLIYAVRQSKSQLKCFDETKIQDEQTSYFLCRENFCFTPTTHFSEILKKIKP